MSPSARGERWIRWLPALLCYMLAGVLAVGGAVALWNVFWVVRYFGADLVLLLFLTAALLLSVLAGAGVVAWTGGELARGSRTAWWGAVIGTVGLAALHVGLYVALTPPSRQMAALLLVPLLLFGVLLGHLLVFRARFRGRSAPRAGG